MDDHDFAKSFWFRRRSKDPPLRFDLPRARVVVAMVAIAVIVFVVAVAPLWELFETHVVARFDKPFYIRYPCWVDNETGHDVDCGYLYVAENRADKDSPTIRIPVVILRGKDGASDRPPVLHIAGGPGGTSYLGEKWFVAWALLHEMAPWLKDRDVILFDQRGAGISVPSLDCPEIKLGNQDWRSVRSWLHDAIKACRERLVGSGVDLRQYHTPAIVADIIDLRRELGVDSWDVWGGSYGTRIALELMRSDAAAINSAVLLDVVTTDPAQLANSRNRLGAVIRSVAAWCRFDADCNAAYPDMVERFEALLRRFGGGGRSLTLHRTRRWNRLFKVKMNEALFKTIAEVQLLTSYSIQEFPKFVSDLYWSINLDVLEQAARDWRFIQIGPEVNLAAGWTVKCNDWGADFSTAYPAQRDPNDKFFEPADWGFGVDGLDLCQVWLPAARAVLDTSRVTSDIPTILIVGALDPITSPSWARHVRRTLRNGHLFIFPSGSHDTIFNRCANELIGEFLDAPRTRPTNPCYSEDRGPEFVLPE